MVFKRFWRFFRRGRAWMRIFLSPEEEKLAACEYLRPVEGPTAKMGFLKVELTRFPSDEEYDAIAGEINALAEAGWIVQPFLRGDPFPPWVPGRKETWLRVPVAGDDLYASLVRVGEDLENYRYEEITIVGIGLSIRPTESSTGYKKR